MSRPETRLSPHQVDSALRGEEDKRHPWLPADGRTGSNSDGRVTCSDLQKEDTCTDKNSCSADLLCCLGLGLSGTCRGLLGL